MGRASGDIDIKAQIKILSGNTLPLPIKYKRNNDDTISVYVMRTIYTPVIGAIMLTGNISINTGLLTVLNDNSEIDDNCVDFTLI